MKILIVHPNYFESAKMLVSSPRTFNNLVCCSKFLSIFEKVGAWKPQFKVWYPFQDALKYYYNCLLKVCKEIYGYNTKYEYLQTPNVKDIIFPDFTDITFASQRDFLLKVSPELYLKNPIFKESAHFSEGAIFWEYKEKEESGKEIYKVQGNFGVLNREDFIKERRIDIIHYNFNAINQNLDFTN